MNRCFCGSRAGNTGRAAEELASVQDQLNGLLAHPRPAAAVRPARRRMLQALEPVDGRL
jgi:hypothetical protein